MNWLTVPHMRPSMPSTVAWDISSHNTPILLDHTRTSGGCIATCVNICWESTKTAIFSEPGSNSPSEQGSNPINVNIVTNACRVSSLGTPGG